MIFSHPTLGHALKLDGTSIYTLVIENADMFSSYIHEIGNQCRGKDGKFSLCSDFCEPIEMKNNVELVIDPFNLDINKKEILSNMQSELMLTAYDADHYSQTYDVIQIVSDYLKELYFEINQQIDSNEIDGKSIIKMASPKFKTNDEDLLQRICDYLDVLRTYSKVKLIIFVNMKSFISIENCNLLNEYIVYNKMNVIYLEYTQHRLSKHEILSIIDADLCEICSDK